jgi:hypothetical protein
MVCLPNGFDFGRHEERRMSVSAYRRVGVPWSVLIAIKQLLFRGEPLDFRALYESYS